MTLWIRRRPTADTARDRRGSTTPPRRSLRRDGTLDIVGGSIVAGLGGLAYEAVGGRTFGAEGFAPISTLLTLHFLVFVIVLVPLEQVVIRRLTLDRTRPGVPIGAMSVIAVAMITAPGLAWLLRDRLFGGDPWFALVLAASVVTHGTFVLARGSLAGRRRYRSYGMASGAASLARLAAAGVAVGVAAGVEWFALALAIGPLVVLAWRPFGSGVDDVAPGEAIVDPAASERTVLAGLMLAAAASQALLITGPVVAALLGASASAVSALFVVFSLARAPLSVGYNLIARVLGPLTELADRGDHVRLRGIVRRVTLASVVAALGAGAVGEWLGPAVIHLIFGSDFRPARLVTAGIAAGVALAAGSLVIGQVFVARGDTGRLADGWLAATALAAATVVLAPGGPVGRVVAGFVVGEAGALLLLARSALAPPAVARGRTRGVRLYPVVKRVFDLMLAVVVATVTLPLLVAAIVGVWVTSGRPALLRQTRIGRNGEPFGMWKLRTMHAGAGAEVFEGHLAEVAEAAAAGGVQPRLRIEHDPRVTRLGRVLRRWSIDELPNVWNVIAGDMSFVGPRPLLPDEDALSLEVAGEVATQRRSVPPGITGLAQVAGRDDITMTERANLDARYVALRTFSFDLWILARTLVSVFRHRGT